MRKRRYRLYIDETGDHVFKLVKDRQHRYLGLMGVWFQDGSPYEEFSKNLRELKEDIFGYYPDKPVCLHRKSIVDRKGVFGVLKDPAVNKRFEKELLAAVHKGKYRMCCVVIDKLKHQPKTYRELHHPYHYCLTALLERYAGWLNFSGSVGDVMAESRGGNEDRQLRVAFTRTYDGGTMYQAAEMFQRVLTSKELKLKKKEHAIPGLELADILANPITREVIAESSKKKPPSGNFGADLIDAARRKFNCRAATGRVLGYGKVLLQ